MPTMRVEFLIAWADGTWTTTIETVLGDSQETDKLIDWAQKNLAPLAKYHKAILFAVYGVPAQEE
jgi:hypothetical protein